MVFFNFCFLLFCFSPGKFCFNKRVVNWFLLLFSSSFIECCTLSFSVISFLLCRCYCHRSPFSAPEFPSLGQKRLCRRFLGFWLRSPRTGLSRPRLELGHWLGVPPDGLWGHFCFQLEWTGWSHPLWLEEFALGILGLTEIKRRKEISIGKRKLLRQNLFGKTNTFFVTLPRNALILLSNKHGAKNVGMHCIVDSR